MIRLMVKNMSVLSFAQDQSTSPSLERYMTYPGIYYDYKIK